MGALRPRPRRHHNGSGRNATKDRDRNFGAEVRSREELKDYVTEHAEWKESASEEHAGMRAAAASPVAGMSGKSTDKITLETLDGEEEATDEQVTQEAGTGRRLALTSPRPAWPRCAWTPAAPRNGFPRH